jgi:hypothetical protein
MTQENKELLLKDLTTRLLYGVKCTTKSSWNGIYTIEGYKDDRFFLDCPVYDEGDDEWMIESVVPYLRPMSSMTSQEWCELCDCDTEDEKAAIYIKGGRRFVSHVNKETFLNSRHFDYRGLIEKGLAIEAPEGMYKKGE